MPQGLQIHQLASSVSVTTAAAAFAVWRTAVELQALADKALAGCVCRHMALRAVDRALVRVAGVLQCPTEKSAGAIEDSSCTHCAGNAGMLRRIFNT